MAYNTSAAIKTRIGIAGSGDDAFITALLAVAYAEITEKIGYIFQSTNATTRYFDAKKDVNGRDLDVGYLFGISAVVNGDGSSLVENTDYVYDYDKLRILRSTGKYWTYSTDPENAIAVTATFGRDTSHNLYSIAVELEAGLVQMMYRARDTGIPSEVSFTTGGAIILAPSKAWPVHLRQWLDMLKPVIV